jgi:heterodisulfide reductase subunit A
VTLYTNTEVVGASGYVGDFRVQLRQKARGVSGEAGDLLSAIEACPVEIPDEFNYGLTMRKAIYQRYPGCYPQTPAIDWEHCTQCGECAKRNPQDIQLKPEEKIFDVNVGAIVIATGFTPYELRPGEFGHGEYAEVVTLPQLIRLLALNGDGAKLTWNGHDVRNIAMIRCVGSRQVEGVHEPQADGEVNNYCSRVCCTATLQIEQEIHERFPHINIFDMYQDIRTYGRGHEDYYTHASENGVRFLRFHAEEGPRVEKNTAKDGYPLVVKVKDYLTWGEELEVPVDLVVLAVGMMPSPIEDLMNVLKVTPGADRFLLEVHPKLRPVETAVAGIVLAGTAQSPMNIQECCATAEAAVAKIAGPLSLGRVELEPFVARVNLALCTGTGACVEACQYEGAISLQSMRIDGKEVQRAVVSPANCVGCGVCVSVCPNRALDIQGWTLDQYEAMVEAIGAELPAPEEVKA